MSAPGNSRRVDCLATTGGFTLLELLLVVALMAMAGAGVVMSMRESGEQQLAREAQRLVAMLDAARAQSRASGVAVVWRPDAQGFSLEGLQPPQTEPTAWLEPGTVVRDAQALVLGPEPIIERQQIELQLGGQSVWIATDGLRPFSVQADAPAAPGTP